VWRYGNKKGPPFGGPHFFCNPDRLRHSGSQQFVTELKSFGFVGEVLIVLSSINGYSYSVTVAATGGDLVDVSTEAGVAGGFGLCSHNI
jgi:hypothetical protein